MYFPTPAWRDHVFASPDDDCSSADGKFVRWSGIGIDAALWYNPRLASEATLCARICNSRLYSTIDCADTINRAGSKIASPASGWWLINYAKQVPCLRPLRFASAGRQNALTEFGACDTHGFDSTSFQASRRGIGRMTKSGPFSRNTVQAFGWEQYGTIQ